MNILLVSHYAGSKTHGMEYRPFYLAREWVKLGHQVTIVAASYSHLRVEQPRLSGNRTDEDLEGVRYVWLKTPAYAGNGLGRVRNMVGFLVALRLCRSILVRRSEPDVVIASSTYHLDVFSARWISRKCHAKLIYEVRDLWPLTLVEVGGMSRWNPFVATLQLAENYACRNADLVVSTLPQAEEYLREQGIQYRRFEHIPNGIDVDGWEKRRAPLPPYHAKVLQTLRSEGRFVVGYVGTQGVANELDSLLEAAALLPTQALAFVLVGHGPAKERLQNKATQAGQPNVIFLPPVPPASIPALLSFMDALYLGWARKRIYKFGISPNKLLEYMMAAKPIIHSVEAPNDPVVECRCGLSCLPESPAALARAIGLLMNYSPAERDSMGQRGRQYVMLHHDYAVLARRYTEFMV